MKSEYKNFEEAEIAFLQHFKNLSGSEITNPETSETCKIKTVTLWPHAYVEANDNVKGFDIRLYLENCSKPFILSGDLKLFIHLP